MDQNDVFIGPDTTAGIELPQSPLTRKRTLAGEISRPAADSEAGYPAEEVPNHPEAAADPSGFPAAAASAHSSGASSAVEAVSFRLAADPPEAACPATVGCCPAGAHLWAAVPAAAVPAAAASVRSSAASSAVFGHPAIASLAVAALVGLAAKAVLGAELDRRGRGFAVRSD